MKMCVFCGQSVADFYCRSCNDYKGVVTMDKPTVAQVRDANPKFFSIGNKRFFAGRKGREKYSVVRDRDRTGWVLRIHRTRTYKPAQAFSYERTVEEVVDYHINPGVLDLMCVTNAEKGS